MIVKIEDPAVHYHQVVDCDRLDHVELEEGRQFHVHFFKYDKIVTAPIFKEPIKLYILNENGKTIDTIQFVPKQILDQTGSAGVTT